MTSSMVQFQKGDRVSVTEISSNYAQKRNLYNQLMWTNAHAMLIGHVGYINAIDYEKQVGFVKFYYVKDPSAFEICQVVCDWPLDALSSARMVHFTVGDSVALSTGRESTSIGAISRQELTPSGSVKYTVITRSSYGQFLPFLIDGCQSTSRGYDSRDVFMIPIYTGPRLTEILRERCGNPYTSFKNAIHGYNTYRLIDVINEWNDDEESYSKLVNTVRACPQQVRMAHNGELPLFRAVSDNNLNLVVILIVLGADRGAVDEKNRTIIHVASERGLDRMLEGVLYLLKEVNAVTIDGDTPLHLAAKNAHPACIERLFNTQICQPNVQNEQGNTPLHEACMLPESPNKKATISRLLTNNRTVIHLTSGIHMTALHIAIMKGHVSTVDQLMQLRNAHKQVTSKSGMTALHYAASCAHANVINALLAFGFEVHRKDKFGRGVLHYAVEKWTGQVEKDRERLATIQTLVRHGAPTNVVDAYGQNPLYMLVRDLVKNNETYSAQLVPICTQLVRTSLNLDEMASRLRPNWQLATICFLVANGADMSIRDRKGVTAVELTQNTSLHAIISHIAQVKLRPGPPMLVNFGTSFDAAEVTMCTFSCMDSVATVRLEPCGHRVFCVECAQKIPIRRCPVCYHIITSAVDSDDTEVIIGCKFKEMESVENENVSEGVRRQIAEQAAREAKIAVEQEKQNELNSLRERLEQLEMETSCMICMDSKIDLVFNCGHTACSDCAAKLNKQCHICRTTIESTQMIYS